MNKNILLSLVLLLKMCSFSFSSKVDTLFSTGLTRTIWSGIDTKVLKRELSSNCSISLQQVLNGLYHGSKWSYSLIDAGGKFPSGVLDGTFTSIGDYDQCLDLESNDENDNPNYDEVDDSNLFHGKHCMMKFTFNNLKNSEISVLLKNMLPLLGNYTLNLGTCFPSACSNTDIEIIIRNGMPIYLNILTYEF